MRRFIVLLVFAFPLAAWAGYQEEFEREFLSKAWYGEQQEPNVCIDCHASETMKPAYLTIMEAWKRSWHAQNGISCEHCHGGDPRDAELSMSRQRGFLGSPTPAGVPAFCGKCHVGIMANFLESGHGRSLRAGKKNAPTCVTCHGSHDTRKASIEIINEQLCSQCHSYDRARIMKQALFLTEKKFTELEQRLGDLTIKGLFTDTEQKTLFSIEAEFRTLFHTVDVNLVRQRTDEFSARLDQLKVRVEALHRELRFRRNFSAFMMLAFSSMGIVIYVLSRTPRD